MCFFGFGQRGRGFLRYPQWWRQDDSNRPLCFERRGPKRKINQCNFYLVFTVIGNYDTHKQGQSNHTSDEHEQMDEYRVGLKHRTKHCHDCRTTRFLKFPVLTANILCVCVCSPTGFVRSMMTSLTSIQPSSDSTSNRASIALPMLSKLKFLGFALKGTRQ